MDIITKPLENKWITLLFLLIIVSSFSCSIVDNDSGLKPNENLWVTGYLEAGNHNAGTRNSNWGKLKTEEIQWDAFTHIIYFNLAIDSSGNHQTNLDPLQRGNFNDDRLEAIVPAAHQNDTFILFSVGGVNNGADFRMAIKPKNRKVFYNTIKFFISNYGFDGVDLNLRPLLTDDYTVYSSFIEGLAREFDGFKTNNGNRPVLTVFATQSNAPFFKTVQQHVDQINLLTFDLALAWNGWQAYHHTALFSNNERLISTGNKFPSVNQIAQDYITNGVTRSKIAIGLDFKGYIWHEVNLLEKWKTWPNQDLSIMEGATIGGIGYTALASRFDLSKAAWDKKTQTSYLDLEDPKTFVSFDNARSLIRKMDYARSNGLGGVMIWGLGEDVMPDRSQPLLQAVKNFRNK